MQAIPLGRVTVATPGQQVLFSSLLSAAQLALLPPSGLVAKIEVWPDPSATGKVYVKCTPSGTPGPATGVVISALPVPSGGYPIPWCTGGDGSNQFAYSQYGLDVATGGDGAYVTLWVK